MPDTATQIREYYEAITLRVDPDEILEDSIEPVVAPAFRRRWFRGPLVAAAAAAAVLLIVGGVAVLLRAVQSEAPVVDEPDTPVVEEPETLGPLDSFEIGDIPSFQATLSFNRTESPDSGGTVRMTYEAGTGAFHLVYLEDASGEIPPGSYLAWNGLEKTFQWAGEGDETYAGSPYLPPAWATFGADACRTDIEFLAPEKVAGRDVLHVRCAPLRGEWDLWIDEETGLILKLEGSYGIGEEVTFWTESDGGFEVTELMLDPEIDPSLFDFGDRGVLAAIPSFHAELHLQYRVRPYRAQVWYRSPSEWRIEVIEGDAEGISAIWDESIGALPPGSFVVQRSDQQFTYQASEGWWEVVEVAPQFPIAVSDFLPLPEAYRTESCSSLESLTFAGRAAQRLSCSVQGTGTLSQLVVDDETLMVLQLSDGSASLEVTSIEFEPAFPEGIFELAPPPGSVERQRSSVPSQHPLVNKPAPELSGTLLDGSAIDLSKLQGQRVAVLFWATWCLPCFDALDEFERAYRDLDKNVQFVAVAWLDDPTSVREVSDRGELGVLILVDEDGQIADSWQVEGAPWLVLVNEQGIVMSSVGVESLADVQRFIVDAPW